MTEMVEQVARAICKADGLDPDADWRDVGRVKLDIAIKDGEEQRWRTYVRKAHAALAAMRKPTEGMTVAGGEAIGPYLMASKDGRTGEVTPGLVQGGIHTTWQAMIDAAMAEKPA